MNLIAKFSNYTAKKTVFRQWEVAINLWMEHYSLQLESTYAENFQKSDDFIHYESGNLI